MPKYLIKMIYMMIGKLIALTIASALVALSILGIYYAHQLPTEETITITLLSYEQTGVYDYIAYLKPNILYNQSTLKPGEGTLYIKITKSINVTLSYTFQCSRPASGIIEYKINSSLESTILQKGIKSTNWKKSLVVVPRSALNLTGTTQEFSFNYLINVTSIEGLIRAIDTETGTSASEYTLTIDPQINVTATTDTGPINETFIPTLTVMFSYRTQQGNLITTEGLQHTRQGTITQTQRTPLTWATNLRYANYAFLAIAIPALLYTAWTTTKTKPSEEKLIWEIMEPYKDIIAETTQELTLEGRTAMPMKTLEDLAKVADILGKPVLHTQKGQAHTFYVLDDSIRYEYTTTTPSKFEEEA